MDKKIRLATAWLGGCAGCHMSFLDLDERLIDLHGAAEVVYSPIMDVKEFPQNVDVTLVETGFDAQFLSECGAFPAGHIVRGALVPVAGMILAGVFA